MSAWSSTGQLPPCGWGSAETEQPTQTLPCVCAAHTSSPANPNIALTGSCPWLLCRSVPRPWTCCHWLPVLLPESPRSPKSLLLCPNSVVPCPAVFLLIRRACLGLHRVDRVLRDLPAPPASFRIQSSLLSALLNTKHIKQVLYFSIIHTLGRQKPRPHPQLHLYLRIAAHSNSPWHRASRHPILPTGYPL